MKPDGQNIKVIISGGGTGGHIFPAISIADEIKSRLPKVEILFVGALGKMEMERVPAAGYEIVGLPIAGIQRKLTIKNLWVLLNLIRSMQKAKKLISTFNPDIAIGVGGYASGPVIRAAGRRGIPTLLQEQNNYAGVTNKLLAKRADRICVAYNGMEKYFPGDKIVLTGNPVRKLAISPDLKHEGMNFFGLDKSLPVVLVLGGSLGARTVNEAILKNLHEFNENKIQLIWQTGKFYFEEMQGRLPSENSRIKLHAFISRMDLAYNVADLVISRAGAISISELCLAGKASLLIPSPNVAEDHQTKNALALVKENAAEMIKDSDALNDLGSKTLQLIANTERRKQLGENIGVLAKPEASREIVDEVFKMIDLN